MSKRNTAKKPNRFGWSVFLIVAVGVVLYFYTSGDDTTAAPAKKAAASSKSSSDTTQYTPADYIVHFPDLPKKDPRDTFLPLISKSSGSAGAGGPDTIPSLITGGDPNWQFTGMVQVNGTTQALLEDPKAQLMDYVSLGQHWKKAKMKRISDSAIELLADSGKTVTVKMSEGPKDQPGKEASAPVDEASAQQAQPAPLAGQIGPVDVTPLPPNQGGGGGGWGGRRRRGGFRGGGGG